MIQVIIDQKVLIDLMKTKKIKKNYSGDEFVMKSFQWIICLFTLNTDINISKAIWDLIFLEGGIAIFKTAFTLIELENKEFSEKEFLKSYFSHRDITESKIK